MSENITSENCKINQDEIIYNTSNNLNIPNSFFGDKLINFEIYDNEEHKFEKYFNILLVKIKYENLTDYWYVPFYIPNIGTTILNTLEEVIDSVYYGPL